MTDPISPIGGPSAVEGVDRRESDRRQRDRRASKRTLVPTGEPVQTLEPDPAPARPAVHPASGPGAAAFVAQQIGQKGQKRGLRGGAPVLNAARAAYLGTEYSGEAERRPAVGKARKTDV